VAYGCSGLRASSRRSPPKGQPRRRAVLDSDVKGDPRGAVLLLSSVVVLRLGHLKQVVWEDKTILVEAVNLNAVGCSVSAAWVGDDGQAFHDSDGGSDATIS